MEEKYVSRFFDEIDNNKQKFYYEMPIEWWSRIYEYHWASEFVEKNDICLDAACGVSHPFKFWLTDNANKVYANDFDKRLINIEEVKRELEDIVGVKWFNEIENAYKKIEFNTDNLTKLSYSDKQFNKTFCISVLEHIDKYLTLDNYKTSNLYKAITELNRVTKDDGLLIFTFDYPHINLTVFNQIIKDLNLNYFDYKDNLSEKNVTKNNLKCFRAVLKK